MAFKETQSLDADTVISIGGFNKKAKKENPTGTEGYYLGSKQVTSAKSTSGFSTLHYLQTPKGNLGVWGKTDMDKKLGGVTPGTMVRITHQGLTTLPNGNDMHKYKVEVDEENTIDVNFSAPAPTAPKAKRGGYSEFADGEESEEQEYERDEDEVEYEAPPARSQGLSAAERQAKVQALLSKNKK